MILNNKDNIDNKTTLNNSENITENELEISNLFSRFFYEHYQ